MSLSGKRNTPFSESVCRVRFPFKAVTTFRTELLITYNRIPFGHRDRMRGRQVFEQIKLGVGAAKFVPCHFKPPPGACRVDVIEQPLKRLAQVQALLGAPPGFHAHQHEQRRAAAQERRQAGR